MRATGHAPDRQLPYPFGGQTQAKRWVYGWIPLSRPNPRKPPSPDRTGERYRCTFSCSRWGHLLV